MIALTANDLPLPADRFVQKVNSCMIAAYGTALFPFTRRSVNDYLQTFAKHFGMAVPVGNAERAYEYILGCELGRGVLNANQIITCVHNTSLEPFFLEARQQSRVRYLVDAEVQALANNLPAWALAGRRVLASVTVKKPDPANQVPFLYHAVCVGYDPAGTWFYYDANPGEGLQTNVADFASVASLGFGDGLLIEQP